MIMMAAGVDYPYEPVTRGFFGGLFGGDTNCITADVCTQTGIFGIDAISDDGLIELFADGKLIQRKGYLWDGASGPTWDTKTTIWASGIHDPLYQLMIEGSLPLSFKFRVDSELYVTMRTAGAGAFRASQWLYAVDKCGSKSLAA
jgi:hypothetical protein